MNEYNLASKYAQRGVDAVGLLRWLLPQVLRNYDFVRWLPTETIALPDEPERRCDTVASFQHRLGSHQPVAEVIEFQTIPRETLSRLAEYGLRVYREVPFQRREPPVRYSVRLAVVYLTGQPTFDFFSLGEVDGLEPCLFIRADSVILSRIEAARVLEGVALGTISRAVLSFVPLTHGADDANLITSWREVAMHFTERATLGFLALTFAKLVAGSKLWTEGLRRWNVEESPYWQEIRTTALVEGRVEGRVIQAREILFRFLGNRFGSAVQNELRPQIDQTTNVATLDRCLDLVLANKLEEVRQELMAEA